ncbi:hypothetical protein [Sporosarcina sp. Marseille-Q4943]|uniref:DUF7662 domain-containing protein n=1 Tax=Sporosarcina sp. Marseille-Q4943 TaxID=2942204 RepID=UPI00208DB302|nr:hypothetical protein [Sporosarcina sp. Marseille-Q4943]
MPKGDAYLGLKNHLQNSKEEEITLSFEDIEKIVGRKLPQSAYKHPESWWSNNYDHSQAIAWMDAGYNTDFVTDTYADRKIVFVKVIK